MTEQKESQPIKFLSQNGGKPQDSGQMTAKRGQEEGLKGLNKLLHI